MFRSKLRSFLRDRGGNVAMTLGLSMPVLAGGMAAAVDMNTWYSSKTRLQLAVDGAALAAAREMQIVATTPQQISEAAKSYLQSSLAAKGPATHRVEVKTTMASRSVEVFADAEVSPFFSRVLFDGLQMISARAVANLKSSPPLCLLGLDGVMSGTILIERNARITARNCSVYSNSISRSGFTGDQGADGTAALFCSAGGSAVSQATFNPAPISDCPPVKDPLVGRASPPVGSCIATQKLISNQTTTLSPGTYCGGLIITKNANVTLQAGIYIIKDGPLVVNKHSVVTGQNVGLYFVGDKASLLFDKNSSISLTAPKDGPMTGFLMAEDPSVFNPLPAPHPTDGLIGGLLNTTFALVNTLVSILPPLPIGSPKMREYHILSDDARNLLGTIYLPSGRLAIDSKKSVADRSAYTVLVVRRLDLFDGPNLTLNSDYGSTDIPTPKGVGPSTGIALAE